MCALFFVILTFKIVSIYFFQHSQYIVVLNYESCCHHFLLVFLERRVVVLFEMTGAAPELRVDFWLRDDDAVGVGTVVFVATVCFAAGANTNNHFIVFYIQS